MRPPVRKHFAVGAKVRVIMPGVNGIVTQVDDTPTMMTEYWHRIQTERGERRESGSNLELRARLVACFRSLEHALDEHKQKGTVAGDPVYEKIFEQLTSDLSALGVEKDQVESLAEQVGHRTTFARLQRLRKRPIGFSS